MEVKRYFERKVSLLSTSDVRYDGELYTVDPSEQSIALKHVNCMGTEGRRSGDQAIAPSDCTYEFIIFRAVNIRELWLIEENGMRRSLNEEVLMPLRTGQTSNQYGRQKAAEEHYDDVPKRKVGYQTRNMGGYQDYYQRPPQQSYPGYSMQGSGYPQQTYEQESYPPLPNSQRAYYAQQRQYYQRQQHYYPNTNYQQRYNSNSQYYNQGYQPQRYQRQYVDNRGYYSYGNQSNYYNNNQRRYQRQNNYYNNNQRTGNRGRQNRNYQNKSGKAGTGAFLDRRLQGDDIDIENAHDFDFGAALAEFGPIETNGVIVANDGDSNDDKDDGNVNKDNANDDGDNGSGGADDANANADDDEKAADSGDADKDKKYDPINSFYDGLMTETRKSKPKINVSAAKNTDSKTFGSVATTYKSRHINRSGSRRQNYSQNRRQNYNQNYGANQAQRRNQQSSYGSNRWVRR